MNQYTFSAPDPSSDIGSWEVIINASSQEKATNLLKDHLKSRGRKYDKEIECRVVKAPSRGVIYSNVETR